MSLLSKEERVAECLMSRGRLFQMWGPTIIIDLHFFSEIVNVKRHKYQRWAGNPITIAITARNFYAALFSVLHKLTAPINMLQQLQHYVRTKIKGNMFKKVIHVIMTTNNMYI